MNQNTILGALALTYSFITLYGYITKSEKMFWKKNKMKEVWGEKLGVAIHFTGYIIVPFLVGITLLIS